MEWFSHVGILCIRCGLLMVDLVWLSCNVALGTPTVGVFSVVMLYLYGKLMGCLLCCRLFGVCCVLLIDLRFLLIVFVLEW